MEPPPICGSKGGCVETRYNRVGGKKVARVSRSQKDLKLTRLSSPFKVEKWGGADVERFRVPVSTVGEKTILPRSVTSWPNMKGGKGGVLGR